MGKQASRSVGNESPVRHDWGFILESSSGLRTWANFTDWIDAGVAAAADPHVVRVERASAHDHIFARTLDYAEPIPDEMAARLVPIRKMTEAALAEWHRGVGR